MGVVEHLAGFGYVPQNAIDIELCLRITAATATLTSFDMDYSVRSICFAASWYVPFAAKNESFDSGSGHVVLSGKTNGVVAAHVMCNCNLLSEGHRTDRGKEFVMTFRRNIFHRTPATPSQPTVAFALRSIIMQGNRLIHFVGIIALLLSYDSAKAQQSEQQPTFRLTTILGTEIVTSIDDVSLKDIWSAKYPDIIENTGSGNALFNSLFTRRWDAVGVGFLVSLEDQAYVSIPFSFLKEAHLDSMLHTVALTNGSTFIGKLVGVIYTPERKVYDLADLKSITAEKKGAKKKSPALQTPASSALWELSLPEPYNRSFKVRNVRFAFSYSTREKVGGIVYTIENVTRVSNTETFLVSLAGKDVVANLTDFVEIRINEKAIHKMTLTPARGTPIDTNPVLEITDTYGKHNPLAWILRADLADNPSLSIAVEHFAFACRFRKISQ